MPIIPVIPSKGEIIKLLSDLSKTGLIPENTSRIIIDMDLQNMPPKIYYQTYACRKFLSLSIGAIIEKKELFRTKSIDEDF